MLFNSAVFRFLSTVSLTGVLAFIGCLFALTVNVRAGFLYVLNERSGFPNQIYGFSVNEVNGALTPLAGFPIASGGNGASTEFSEMLVIDRTNFRLYVINNGSGSLTVSGFSINVENGELEHLPFSPFGVPGFSMRTLKVHPSGSPLVVGDFNGSRVFSINITPGAATPAAGSPYSTDSAQSYSSLFSRDGYFYYAGGGTGNNFAGFSVNPTNGVLTPLPGSPFFSGASGPIAYATDSIGRFFTANRSLNQVRAFITGTGVPFSVAGNPFTSGLNDAVNGVLHPNERFYYVSDDIGNRVGAYQISGSGIFTALAPVAGSPFNSNGIEPGTIVLNNAGRFLFAANRDSRNITTYSVSSTTGALTFSSVQPANTLGTTGNLIGMGYLPTVFTVLNTNDGGTRSLRQAVSSANLAGGGIIFFHPLVFTVPRTISLTSGEIPILEYIEIVGTGADRLTVRNTAPFSPTSRVFTIDGNGVKVSLSGMTITGGNVDGRGGGIEVDVDGFLTVTNCVVSNNTSNAGGGGIFGIVGTIIINNSTISGNSSTSGGGGGGIDTRRVLFITNSTISGNTKTGGSNNGGGVFATGSATIIHSTITNNSTNSGAGGLSVGSGTFMLRNSIVAGNKNNSTFPDVSGVFASPGGGYNVIGNVGTATGLNQPGDQTGTGAAPLDPLLVQVLALNGGKVPTHALFPSSPALDMGFNLNYSTDQRGFNRPFDNAAVFNPYDGSDSGAFERRAVEPNITAPFDFDGDSKTDISIFRPSDGSWWYSRSSDNNFRVYSFGVSSDSLAPGDFTGDGRADIAVFRSSTGEWFIQRSEDNSFFSFPFGQAGDVAVPSDFDGDGRADAAVFRPSNSTWFILNSGSGTTSIVQFGTTGDKPLAADFDGDGRSDIAVFRPADGSWWYLQSSNAAFKVYIFGVGTDKTVPGDWTGDGKADIAVYRRTTGFWFVQRSEDNSFFSFPFGASGDIPAPGDYDGDGRLDAAIFRPAEGNWYVQRSTAGTLIQAFGTAGDIPVPAAFVGP